MKKEMIILFVTIFYSSFGFSQNIPPNYQALYNTLDTKLNEIDQALSAKWDGEKSCTNYCTSLITANSGRGEILLDPKVLDGIQYYLDAFDTLGIKAVDLAIQYPILVDSFPKSQEYLNFYKQVVQAIRDHDFKLIIGCQSTFRDTIFGKLDVDAFYEGLDKTRFKAEKRQMIETIINELKPDYLTIETEQTTQAMNLGLDYDVPDVVEYIQYFLNGLDKKTTLIGGGSGSWDEIDYIEAIAQQPGIDYIDFHIYPIVQDFFVDKVFKIDSIAAHYNKKMVIGECWLHKANNTDLSTLAPHEIFVRDVFSFWTPLDSLFTECIVKLSHFSKCELSSLIWATFFFSYLDYLPEHDTMPLDQLYNLGYMASSSNILSKTFSPIGALYHDLIHEACTTTDIHSTENSNPKDYILYANYPNPFNSETCIQYSLSMDSDVKLDVLNVKGQNIKTLINGNQTRGEYHLKWNGKDMNNRPVSSGLYLYKLVCSGNEKVRKMLLIQ